MKKLMNLFLAMAMVLSITFVGAAISSNGNLSIQAQTRGTVKVERKGAIRQSYAGGKYVVRKTWTGTKWVSKKVWIGTKWTGRNSWKVTKKVGRGAKRILY
jgi:hypothetical protein